jgi:hypothetical protein
VTIHCPQEVAVSIVAITLLGFEFFAGLTLAAPP